MTATFPTPKLLSKRFVHEEVIPVLNKLCLEFREKKGSYTKDECRALAKAVILTGSQSPKPIPTLTEDALFTSIQRDLPFLHYHAAALLHGGSIGYMAPELFDRGGDAIQAALWIADRQEARKE